MRSVHARDERVLHFAQFDARCSKEEHLGVTSGAVGQDAVGLVLADWQATRSVKLLRRFRHGSGGTSLASVDGRSVVLEAWPTAAPVTANLQPALRRMDATRRRGVPIPELLEHGKLADNHYLLYAYLPGRPRRR
ncbi:MAG: hypothetical protein ACHQ7M_20090, partial [Chloroflexota bacterium]